MTTNRIDHTNCSHPRTTAARTACRKARAADATRRDRGWTPPNETLAIFAADRAARKVITDSLAEVACTINEAHCENCGSTDYEDVNLGDQGYTRCCNELVSRWSGSCRNHHAG
jgi:hypothetical protein